MEKIGERWGGQAKAEFSNQGFISIYCFVQEKGKC